MDDSLPFVLNIVLALIFSLLGSFAVMVGGPFLQQRSHPNLT